MRRDRVWRDRGGLCGTAVLFSVFIIFIVIPDPKAGARLLAYRGRAQFFNRDFTLGAVVIGKAPPAHGPEAIEVVDLASGQVRWRWPMSADYFRRVIFSPDGRWAIATVDRTPLVWDLQTGQPVEGSPLSQFKNVHAIAFSPDGTHAVVQQWQSLQLLSTRDWTIVAELHKDGSSPSALAFSPDNRRVAAGHSGAVHVWDIQTGQEVRSLDLYGPRPMLSVAVSPDGQWLAAGTERHWSDDGSGSLLLWPLRGDGVAGGMRELGREEEAAIQSVAFSPDSRRLATTSFGNVHQSRTTGLLRGQVSLCELPACDEFVNLLDEERRVDRPNQFLHLESAAKAAVFTPDGKTLIAAVLGTTAHTDEEIRTHEFQPYSRLVFYDLTSAPPRERRVVRPPYRIYRGEEFDGAGVFVALALSPDGRRVATAYSHPEHHDRPVDLWSATTGRWLRGLGKDRTGATGVEGLTGMARGVAFSPDGKWLATTGWDPYRGGFIALWNTATGQLARAVDRDPLAANPSSLPASSWAREGPHAVAFHPDGTRFVTAECGSETWESARRARITMWDVAGKATRWSVATDGRCVEQVAFGPGGRWLAAVGHSGITIRDASTGALMLTLALRKHDQWVAWTPDGRYTGTDEGIARLTAIRDGMRARPLSSLPAEARVPDLLERVLNPR